MCEHVAKARRELRIEKRVTALRPPLVLPAYRAPREQLRVREVYPGHLADDTCRTFGREHLLGRPARSASGQQCENRPALLLIAIPHCAYRQRCAECPWLTSPAPRSAVELKCRFRSGAVLDTADRTHLRLGQRRLEQDFADRRRRHRADHAIEARLLETAVRLERRDDAITRLCHAAKHGV